RRTNEPLLERIDVRVVLPDVGIPGRDLLVDPSEEFAARGHVRFVDAGHAARPIRRRARSLLREFEGETDHALGALSGDDPAVHRELVNPAAREEPASRRVEAL